MSKYLGDFALGQTVRTMFATNNAAGGRVDPSSAWETADFRVYKNGSATQRTSEAGYTATSTFDSMTGITSIAIDTADNTDSGFFVATADYCIVAYPDETVDSQNVAAVIAEFSIENRFGSIAALPALSVGAHPQLGIIDSGTAQSASSTTLVLRSAATFADDTVNGATLMVFGSTQGYWQTRSVTDYVLSTDTATVDAWTVTPTGTLSYVLFAGAPSSATSNNEIADAILNRDMSVGTDSGSTTVRTVRQALRALRNRFVLSAGTVTVYKEDDSTASFTAVVTGTPAVTQVNPAGGS